MNQDPDLGKIMERIGKLMEMSEHPGTPINEKAVATAMAAKLLLQYNIDMADIRRRSGTAAGPVFVKRSFLLPGTKETATHWRRRLTAMIAHVNLCYYIYTNHHELHGTRKRWHITGIQATFVGEAHNTEISEYMVCYLINEIWRLALLGYRQIPSDERGKYVRGQWLTAFCDGAVSVINRRLTAEYEAALAAANARALVVVSHEAVKTAASEMIAGLRPGSKLKVNNGHDAFDQGINAGKGIALRKGIEDGDATLALEG